MPRLSRCAPIAVLCAWVVALASVGGCRSIAGYDSARSDTGPADARVADTPRDREAGAPAEGGIPLEGGAPIEGGTPLEGGAPEDGGSDGGCASPTDCPLRKCALFPECQAGRCVYTPITGSPPLECRPAVASSCDEAEYCDGVSLDCPSDTGAPAPTALKLDMTTFTIIKAVGYATKPDEVIARCSKNAGKVTEARGILVADLSPLGSRKVLSASLQGCRTSVRDNYEAELYAAAIANPPTNADFDAKTSTLLQSFPVNGPNYWEISVAPTLLDKGHVGFLLKLVPSACVCPQVYCLAREHVFAGDAAAVVPGSCKVNDWKLSVTACP